MNSSPASTKLRSDGRQDDVGGVEVVVARAPRPRCARPAAAPRRRRGSRPRRPPRPPRTAASSSSLRRACRPSSRRYCPSLEIRTITSPGPPRSAWRRAPPEPRAQLGLHLGQLVVDLGRARELARAGGRCRPGPGPSVGEVVERAGRLELGDGVGARAHLLGLVGRALHGEADVGHLLADPGGRLGDPHLRLGGRVLRLDDLLLGAEGLDLRAQLLLGVGELLLLGLELGDLLVERLQLGLGDVLALERDAREVLVAGRQRLAGLRVELDDGLLELLGLHLQALLRRDDVRDALLDVLQRFQLLLVAVVERLARVFRPVEQPRDLGLDDGGHASAHAGHADSSIAGRVQVSSSVVPRGSAHRRRFAQRARALDGPDRRQLGGLRARRASS